MMLYFILRFIMLYHGLIIYIYIYITINSCIMYQLYAGAFTTLASRANGYIDGSSTTTTTLTGVGFETDLSVTSGYWKRNEG